MLKAIACWSGKNMRVAPERVFAQQQGAAAEWRACIAWTSLSGKPWQGEGHWAEAWTRAANLHFNPQGQA